MTTTVAVQVPVSLIDKLSAPLKGVLKPFDTLGAKIGKAGAEMDRLGSNKSTIELFRKVKASSVKTGIELDAAKERLTKLGREMSKTKTPTKAMVAEFDRAKRSVNSLKDSQTVENKKLAETRKALEAAGISTKNLSKHNRDLGAQMAKGQRDLDRQNDKLAEMKRRSDAVGKAQEKMQGRMATAGKIGIGGAAAYGVKRVVTSFTDSIRDVEKAKGDLATLGVKDLEAVVSKARELQWQVAGITADAFVRASYDIKSGISSLTDEGVADMTAAAMMVAKATKGVPEQMTSLFATSYGIFKKQFADMGDAEFGNMFGAALSASVQQFKTDGGAMQQAIESAGAGAVNLGMEMTEQLALLGMMQQQMQAGEAGTALRAFASNAAKAHEAFGKMKVTSERPIRVRVLDEDGGLRAMPDILADLKGRYGDTLDAFEAAEIKKAFGTDEAMKMINALYGQEAAVRANQEALKGAAAQGAEFTKTMAQAADNNWDATMVLMGQKMDVIQQKIGDRLLPAVTKLIPVFDAVFDSVLSWIDVNPELVTGIGIAVVAIGGIAAVAAPVLIATSAMVSSFGLLSYGATRLGISALSVGKGIGKAGGGLMWLGKKVLPIVGKAFLMIGRAMMANPLGLAIAVIAGGALLIYKYWEPISAFFSEIWDKIGGDVMAAWDGIKTMFLNYTPAGLIYTHWESISGFFGNLWARVKSGAAAGWDLIKNLFFNYTPAGLIYTHWDGIAGWFALQWSSVHAGASIAWDLIKAGFLNYTPHGLIYTHWDGIAAWFGDLWTRVKDTFATQWDGIRVEVAKWPSDMRKFGEDIIQKLIDGIRSKFAAMAKAVSDALAFLNPFSNVGVNLNLNDASGTPREGRGSRRNRRKAVGVDVPVLPSPPRASAFARGGTFSPGLRMVGELGPELEYMNRSGFIAHNGALERMAGMADRVRSFIGSSGIRDGMTAMASKAGAVLDNVTPEAALSSLGLASPQVVLAGAGARSQGGAGFTYAPQYTIPIMAGDGVDLEEVREMVRDELSEHEERVQAELRSQLND